MITLSRSCAESVVNGRRAGDKEQLLREKFCATLVSRETDTPLRLKKDQASYFLSLPKFAGMPTEVLLEAARPVYVTDRASAIAVLLSRRNSGARSTHDEHSR